MLSDDVLQTLDAALQFMRQDPRHDLNPGYRVAIYEQMGPELEMDAIDQETCDVTGYARRMDLWLRTIRHVQPIWETAHIDWPAAIEWLTLAEDITRRTLVHQLTPTERHQLTDDIFTDWYVTYLVERFADDPLVGFPQATFTFLVNACCDCGKGEQLAEVVETEDGDEEIVTIHDVTIPEERIEIRRKDVPAWAAMLTSGGLPDLPSSRPEDRLTFWEWWLTEAVPLAWAAVPSESGEG